MGWAQPGSIPRGNSIPPGQGFGEFREAGRGRYLPIGFVLQLLHFLPPNSQSQELPLSPGAFFLEFMEVWRELSPKQSGRAAEQRSQEAANAKKQERSSQRSREQRRQPGIPAGSRQGAQEQRGKAQKGEESSQNS